MEKVTDKSGFLFADPSFLTGLGTVMDIGGSLLVYNSSPSGTEADERAIASDWAVVGSDILNATNSLGEKAKTKTSQK